jgi:hypothetical protein
MNGNKKLSDAGALECCDCVTVGVVTDGFVGEVRVCVDGN